MERSIDLSWQNREACPRPIDYGRLMGVPIQAGRGSRPHLAVAQDLLQHVAELRRVLVAVRLHPVLHRRLEQLLLRIGRHRERAVDVAWKFPAVDVLACHEVLLLVDGGRMLDLHGRSRMRAPSYAERGLWEHAPISRARSR